MVVKLYILGLPGSGKSSVYRHIANYLSDRRWTVTHIHDYDILFQMLQEDTEGRFRQVDHGGFDVLDLRVFDEALRKLEEDVNEHLSTTQLEEIVFIEFSRNNYEQAFKVFQQEILKDAYFLHLNVDLETCKQRVRERTAKFDTAYNHYVSDYIFDTYYTGDDGTDLPQILKRNYGIDSLRVKVIDNSISQDASSDFKKQFAEIERFIGYIIAMETPRLQETEPIRKLMDIEAQGELERN